LHEQENRFIRLARIRYFVPHVGRHSTDPAGPEHEHAIAVLAFVVAFEIVLHSDEKILDPHAQEYRNAAARLDAVQRAA
jgi:hypothetical protein